jgi:hypothetical protein
MVESFRFNCKENYQWSIPKQAWLKNKKWFETRDTA